MFTKLKGTGGVPSRLTALVISLLVATSAQAIEPIVTDSTSRSYSESVNTSNSNSNTTSTTNSTTTVKSPPPTAVAPNITSINNDLCAVGVSGAAQTQILGIAIGSTFVDKNCERLKLSKTLYDMGMKVAAVSTLCQDERVFTAMMNAGTPCPVDGKIGEQAKVIWDANPERQPQKVKSRD